MESQGIRRVEPVLEELTGPMTLGAVGCLLFLLPSLSLGPISDTRDIGLVALLVATLGLIAQLVQHQHRTAKPVRVIPILPAHDEGELGPIPGLVVNEVAFEPVSQLATEDQPSDLPRAA